MKRMFGVILCQCDDDLQEPELLSGTVYCSTCHGVIRLQKK
jgi:hypothetical protein